MKIIPYTIEWKEAWIQFARNHPNATIFQSPFMLELYNSLTNYKSTALIAVEADEVIGVLTNFTERYPNLPKQISRNIVFGAPLAQNEDQQIAEALLKAYIRLNRFQSIFSEFRNLSKEPPFRNVFNSLHADYTPHLDIVFDLKKGSEQLWKEVSGTRRKQITRGYNRGASVREIPLSDATSLRSCYSIIEKLYMKLKLPLPAYSIIENAVSLSCDHYSLKCFAVYFEEEIIGSRFVLCYKDLIYDWYAASREEHYDKYPNDILPWEIIKWGAENGYSVFDFGGAGHPDKPYGVRDYKLKFGGRLIQPGRYKIYHIPFIKPMISLLYKLKGK